MATKLMSDDEYVERGGNECPHCRSRDITTKDNGELDGSRYVVGVICQDCGREWEDIYRLIGWSAS